MGVGWERYKRTCKKDKGFRREADGIDQEMVEDLIRLRLEAAKDRRDPDAQEFLINRYDRSSQFRETMKLKRAELALKRKDAENPDTTAPVVQAIRDAFGKSKSD